MSHVYHDELPGYDERQIWKDGCPECEQRGRYPIESLRTLDSVRLRYAFQRTADWNRDKDIGTVSVAEALLLNTLWRIEVMLERECGIPLGTLPEKPLTPLKTLLGG